MLSHGITVLAHAVGEALVVHRQDAHAAGVFHDLPERRFPVGQADEIHIQIDDDPFIPVDAAKLLLGIIHG